MMRFKDFLIEESKPKTNLNSVEYLPLHQGHEGVGLSADMLEGLHKTLLGKSSNVKALVDHDGTPITFGNDPKSKNVFVAHKNKVNYTPQDIQDNYKDNPELAQTLSAAMEHLPKIMPRTKKAYSGKIVYSDPLNIPANIPISQAKFGISVATDSDGKPLSDSERRKFNIHPDVHMIDPELKPNPEKYDVDNQNKFLMSMKQARNSYGKMDPDALDAIAGHSGHIEKHVDDHNDLGTEPNTETYADHLKHEYGGKVINAPSTVAADNRSKKHAKMAEQLINNDKHFSSSISLVHHLKNAGDVLRNISSAGNIVLYHPNGTAVLKKAKNTVTEEKTVSKSSSLILELKDYHIQQIKG